MKRLLFPLLFLIFSINTLAQHAGITTTYDWWAGKKLASPGYDILKDNTKTRAFWDFTSLSGNEDALLSSHPDLTGVWSLSDNGGLNTPKKGNLQHSTTTIPCLKANTASTVKNAFITPAPSTNLLKESHEVHFTIALTDGQVGAGWYLFGSRDGGTRVHDIFITSTGAIQVRYAANATGMSTLVTAAGAIPNGFTGILQLRLVFNFTTDVITAYVNGVAYTLTLSLGNALSTWTPANWISTRACGIGGSWDGAFAADGSTEYKNIQRIAVTELLSEPDALDVMEYMAHQGRPVDIIKKIYVLADLRVNPFTKTTSRSYGVALGNTAPSGDVTVTLSSANGNFTTSSPLTFTTSNYSTPQTFTLTGVNNALVEGYKDDVLTITCTGGGYNGIAKTIAIQVFDSGLDYQFSSGYAWLTGINIQSLSDVATKRNILINGNGSTHRGIFNTAGLPTDAVPDAIETNLAGATTIGQTTVTALVGDASVSKLTWSMLDPSGAAWTHYVYHIFASSPNGQAALVYGGHGSESEHVNALNDLLAQGFDIFYAFMPVTFQNTEANVTLTGTGVSGHNGFVSAGIDSDTNMGLELFFFDKVNTINYAKANYSYTSYKVTGCSGGGWMALMHAAIDTRISKCVPIRATNVMPLRAFTNYGTAADWDYEQGTPGPYYTRNTSNSGPRVDALYQDVSVYDQIILASINNDGTPRRVRMTNQSDDSCCHGKFTYNLWKDYLKSHITSLGGSFDLTLSTDATYSTHGFRANDRAIMINEFQP